MLTVSFNDSSERHASVFHHAPFAFVLFESGQDQSNRPKIAHHLDIFLCK